MLDTPLYPPINLLWLLQPRGMALHRPESQFRSVLFAPGASSNQVGGANSCSADPQPLQSNHGMHCLNCGSAL